MGLEELSKYPTKVQLCGRDNSLIQNLMVLEDVLL
jgi:hypothetical protein